MTPEQKLKWKILEICGEYDYIKFPPVNEDNLDDLYDEAWDEVQDVKNELRVSGVQTGLPCQYSRHYESDSVAAKMPDGSWVGWIYWYGGGKHGNPEAIDWMSDAYDLDVVEEEVMTIKRTFTKKGR